MAGENPRCLFCRISCGQDEKTELLFDEDGIVIFKDIRPAAKHHYLVVPKAHVKDAKQLMLSDAPLLERMVAAGTHFLQQQGGDEKTARLGFHWPPFHMISHLHLHVISPLSEMGLIARGIFMPGTWWFKTPDWVMQQLKGDTKL